MLTVEEAQARILGEVPLLEAEEVVLHDAFGRFLAEDVSSTIDVPPWDNSAMDGYAVRAADTAEGEVALQINETIPAGGVGTIRVEPGTASAIMTGAPVPDGADAVVMVEKTDGAREGEVRIRGRAVPRQNIRDRGLDVKSGDVVLRAGTRLTAAGVGMAASVGLDRVMVRRQPRISVLSTGDEVVLPGNPLGPGQIYSSNNYALCGLVRDAGALPRDCGNAGDDLESLVSALRAAADGADAVCTTGGVSVGAFDYVKEAHAELGAQMDFWKVRMKPGKPLAFGRVSIEGRVVPLFGLPGNPVSCMVNFLEFVRPWIRMAMGDERPWLGVVDAVAGEDFRGRSNRLRLERVVLDREDGRWVARSTGSQSSGVLTSMVRAHGLMIVPIDASAPAQGDPVRVQLLDPSFLDGLAPELG